MWLYILIEKQNKIKLYLKNSLRSHHWLQERIFFIMQASFSFLVMTYFLINWEA